MKTDPKSRVLRVITSYILAPNSATVVQEADTLDALGFDSLDRIELAQLLEAEFGRTVHDDQAAKWVSVSDVISYFVPATRNSSTAEEPKTDGQMLDEMNDLRTEIFRIEGWTAPAQVDHNNRAHYATLSVRDTTNVEKEVQRRLDAFTAPSFDRTIVMELMSLIAALRSCLTTPAQGAQPSEEDDLVAAEKVALQAIEKVFGPFAYFGLRKALAREIQSALIALRNERHRAGGAA